jgi:hypothetical protein
MTWDLWGKRYRLLSHDCQHFFKLFCNVICQKQSISPSSGIGGKNFDNLFHKVKGFPVRWNRPITKYSFIYTEIAGVIVIFVVANPHVTAIFLGVSAALVLVNLGYRGIRLLSARYTVGAGSGGGGHAQESGRAVPG